MRNSTFNPEWGVGRTSMPSLGGHLPAELICLRCHRWQGRWRQEDAEGSEGKGVGKRRNLMWLLRHLLRLEEGGAIPQPCYFLFFLAPFPRHAMLVSNLDHTAKRSNQSILKKINPEYTLEGLVLKFQYFRCEEPTRWKRPWCWERLKTRGEGDNRGWDG